MRRAAIAAAAVVLALVLAAVVVPRLVSLDSFKPRIVAALEEKTGRGEGFRRLRPDRVGLGIVSGDGW